MLFPISNRHNCLNLSSIIRDQPIGWNFSNPHVFHLNWVPSYTIKYTVSITAKFLMMNWKTGPGDPSNACLSYNPNQLPLCQFFTHSIHLYICTHISSKSKTKSSHPLISNPYFLLLFVCDLNHLSQQYFIDRLLWPFVCLVS